MIEYIFELYWVRPAGLIVQSVLTGTLSTAPLSKARIKNLFFQPRNLGITKKTSYVSDSITESQFALPH
jgi:hypothetical protein